MRIGRCENADPSFWVGVQTNSFPSHRFHTHRGLAAQLVFISREFEEADIVPRSVVESPGSRPRLNQISSGRAQVRGEIRKHLDPTIQVLMDLPDSMNNMQSPYQGDILILSGCTKIFRFSRKSAPLNENKLSVSTSAQKRADLVEFGIRVV